MSNKGKLIYTLGLEIGDALKSIETFNGSVQKIDQSLARLSKAQAESGQSTELLADKVQAYTDKEALLEAQLGKLNKTREDLVAKQNEGVKLTDEEAAQVRKLDKEIKSTTKAYEKNISEKSRAVQETDRYKKSLAEATAEAERNEKALLENAKKHEELGKSVKSVDAELVKLTQQQKESGNSTELMAQKTEAYTRKEALLKEQLELLNRERTELINKQQRGIELTEQEAQRSQQLESEIKDVTVAMDENGNALKESKVAAKDLDKTSLGNLKNELKGVKDAAKHVTAGFKTMKSAIKEVVTIGGLLGGFALKESMDYETAEMGITRLAKGGASEEAVLKETLHNLAYSRTEDVQVIFDAVKPLMGRIESNQYGANELGKAANTILDYALAVGVSPEEASSTVETILIQTAGELKDIPHMLSAINQLENDFNIDPDSLMEVLGRTIAPLIGAGYTYGEAVGLSGLVAQTSGLESSGAASALRQLTESLTPASYDLDGRGTQLVQEAVRSLYGDIPVSGMDMEWLMDLRERDYDEFKAVVNEMNIDPDEINQIVASHDIKRDIARYAGLSVDELTEQYAGKQSELLTLFIESLVAETKDEDGNQVKQLQQVLETKDYLRNNQNLRLMINTMANNPELIGEYIGSSELGFLEGTAVADEARDVKDTFPEKMKMYWTTIREKMKELGDALIPFVEAIMDNLMPLTKHIDQLIRILNRLDPAEVGAIIGKLADWFITFKKIQLPTKFLFGFLQTGYGFTRGIKELVALFGKKGALGAAGTLTQGATGATGALKGLGAVMGALVSPTGLAVAALAALTAGVVAAEYKFRKAQENKHYTELDDSVADKVKEDVHDGRGSRATLNLAVDTHGRYTIDETAQEQIIETVENMTTSAQEEVNKRVATAVAVLTGDTEIDKQNQEYLDLKNEELKTSADKMASKQAQVTAILGNLAEVGTAEYEIQIQAIKHLIDEITELYAEVMGYTNEQSQSIYRSVTGSADYSTLNMREKNEVIAELEEWHMHNTNQYNARLEQLAEQYGTNSKQYLTSVKAENEAYLDRQREIETEFFNIYNNTSGLGRFRLDTDMIDMLITGEKDLQMELANTKTFYEDLANVNLQFVDPEDHTIVRAYLADVEKVLGSWESLEQMNDITQIEQMGLLIQEHGAGIVSIMDDLYGTNEQISYVTRIAFMDYVKGLDMTTVSAEHLAEMMETLIDITPQGEEIRQAIENFDFSSLTPEEVEAVKLEFGLDDKGYQDGMETINVWESKVIMDKMLNIVIDRNQIYNQFRVAQNMANQNPVRVPVIYQTTGRSVQTGTQMKQSRLVQHPTYATGTDSTGHPGGLAWVGDGGRREVLQSPTGETYLTPSFPTLVDLPKDWHVWSSIDRYLSGIKRYATGTPSTQIATAGGTSQIVVNVDAAPQYDAVAIKRTVEREIKNQQRQKTRTRRSGGF